MQPKLYINIQTYFLQCAENQHKINKPISERILFAKPFTVKILVQLL